jgi:hypothetical protein
VGLIKWGYENKKKVASDLSDQEWLLPEPLIPAAKQGVGDGLGRGRCSMMLYAKVCVNKPDDKPNRVRRSSIVNRSKPPKAANGALTRGKKVQGRKRHILVDVLGLLLVVVSSQSQSPGTGGGQTAAEADTAQRV